MKILVRKATVNDAGQVADVMNSVIAEGKYTAFDKPFSEEEEREFISSLGARSALYVAEIGGEIGGVQSIDLFTDFAASVRHVATMGTWLHVVAPRLPRTRHRTVPRRGVIPLCPKPGLQENCHTGSSRQ